MVLIKKYNAYTWKKNACTKNVQADAEFSYYYKFISNGQVPKYIHDGNAANDLLNSDDGVTGVLTNSLPGNRIVHHSNSILRLPTHVLEKVEAVLLL